MTKIYKVKSAEDKLGIISIPAKTYQHQVAYVNGVAIEEHSTLNLVILEDGSKMACMTDDLEEVGEVEDDAGTTTED